MRRLIIYPNDWVATLRDCPAGFFVAEEQLCFKTDYITGDKIEAYNSAGEVFCGSDNTLVQPVTYEWEKI